MDVLRKSTGGPEATKDSKPAKKPRKVASGQKEMLMPITRQETGEGSCRKVHSRSARGLPIDAGKLA
jgi:DNA end-binding protein Ku